jgi:hypothetical protein
MIYDSVGVKVKMPAFKAGIGVLNDSSSGTKTKAWLSVSLFLVF